MKKRTKIALICGCIVLAVIIVIVALRPTDVGIRSISVRGNSLTGYTLRLGYYFSNGIFVISNVDPKTEFYYIGEREQPLNEDLGDYCVKVIIADIQPSESFSKKYEMHNTHTLSSTGQDLRFLWAIFDHGIVIYLGSDAPISVEEERIVIDGKDVLASLGGTVKIHISTNKASAD